MELLYLKTMTALFSLIAFYSQLFVLKEQEYIIVLVLAARPSWPRLTFSRVVDVSVQLDTSWTVKGCTIQSEVLTLVNTYEINITWARVNQN